MLAYVVQLWETFPGKTKKKKMKWHIFRIIFGLIQDFNCNKWYKTIENDTDIASAAFFRQSIMSSNLPGIEGSAEILKFLKLPGILSKGLLSPLKNCALSC